MRLIFSLTVFWKLISRTFVILDLPVEVRFSFLSEDPLQNCIELAVPHLLIESYQIAITGKMDSPWWTINCLNYISGET